jgi:hypothetical protein
MLVATETLLSSQTLLATETLLSSPAFWLLPLLDFRMGRALLLAFSP